MPRMPMFPLSSVLFPNGVLPLHVFEPRYRDLVADVLSADARFGVVLIERGSEVGGGDQRTKVGTVAEIVQMEEIEDGRILIVAVGRERIRVVQWLEDDPYPRAEVEPFPDTDANGRLAPALDRNLAARRRLLALAMEMGVDDQALELDLPEDPLAASWVLCAVAPIGPFDAQRVLEHESAVDRLTTLEQLLIDQFDDLDAALHEGGEED